MDMFTGAIRSSTGSGESEGWGLKAEDSTRGYARDEKSALKASPGRRVSGANRKSWRLKGARKKEKGTGEQAGHVCADGVRFS